MPDSKFNPDISFWGGEVSPVTHTVSDVAVFALAENMKQDVDSQIALK